MLMLPPNYYFTKWITGGNEELRMIDLGLKIYDLGFKTYDLRLMIYDIRFKT